MSLVYTAHAAILFYINVSLITILITIVYVFLMRVSKNIAIPDKLSAPPPFLYLHRNKES